MQRLRSARGLDIFERVNSGEPLTRQQMRNALYNGQATIWLKQAAEGDAFRSATGQSLNPKTMRDREAINRYCAFSLIGWHHYTTSDMDGFLAAGLHSLDTLSPSERDELRVVFDRAMILNRQLFGDHAFRKSLTSTGPSAVRSVINISLFEVCAVTMAHLGVELNDTMKRRLHDAVVSLLRDDEFARSITYSTNSTSSVQKRFSAMEDGIRKAVF